MPPIAEALERARRQTRERLKQDRLGPPGDAPSLDTAEKFVRIIDECIDDLNSAVGVSSDVADFIHGMTLPATFPVLWHYRHGQVDRASDLLLHIWGDSSTATGLIDPSLRQLCSSPEPPASLPVDLEDRELLRLFHTAVGQRLREETSAAEGRQILRHLATVLDLSFDELGRMLDASGETVRRWERGIKPIPSGRFAALTSADDALNRLLSLFRPERLPAAIRRPAELFDGERALDWILRGRIQEVADRYDRALSYQQ